MASHLRDDVLARLRWHQARGHATVVVSASLGCYLRPVGRALGLDGVLCSEVAVGTDGRLTGTLLGVNVRRAEKAHRLDAWIAEHRGRVAPAVWAYGDSTGDAELLARADHPVRVGRARLDPISVGDSSTA